MARKRFNKFTIEGQEIETIWTIAPAFLLIFIAIPSIKTLYLIEDSKTPTFSIKITGHQWYWSYEAGAQKSSEIECFIENTKTTRLLKTSDIPTLPTKVLIRAVVTSQDVLHSWTIPSIGMKVDAIPGRLNQIFLLSKRLGIFTGQCSEICGMNHSFMPIAIKFTHPKAFLKTLTN